MILFTAPETFDMRTKLKDLRTESACDLFKCLYRSWSCSPFATIMLSLLSECYEHAAFISRYLSQQIVTLDLLEDLEKIVFLIDDVTFAGRKDCTILTCTLY